ncbi:hypothetical protein ACFLQX_01795 [Bacteroidota bacterium]
MQKEIFILKGQRAENHKQFRERIFKLCDELIEINQPEALKLCITEKKPPFISIIPFRNQKIASLSIHGKNGKSVNIISEFEGFIGAYIVDEAIPVSYEKSWPDGTVTPGACLLTLFNRKPGIDKETFLDRWFNGHTPLSLKLHPLWNYNRNHVRETMTEGSTKYEGIVEEHVKKPSDLLNPFIFFGPPLKMLYHMFLVLKDTRSFIDMKNLETYLAMEYHLKSKA